MVWGVGAYSETHPGTDMIGRRRGMSRERHVESFSSVLLSNYPA